MWLKIKFKKNEKANRSSKAYLLNAELKFYNE